MGKLTAVAVKALVKPGRHSDGDGLHLHVRTVQAKAGPVIHRGWVFRYMRHLKVRDMGLGAYPDISLAEAREQSAEARKLIKAGQDPVEARRIQRGAQVEDVERSFQVAAKQFIAGQEAGWRNEKHAWQWSRTLEQYAYPVFGDWHVQRVDTAAVLQVLQPLWTTKTETASRLRGRIEAVLDASRVNGWRTGENPARWKGHLALILPRTDKVREVEHRPALPWRQVPAFLVQLRKRNGGSARAVEWAILTASRSNEARGMRRCELDLDAGIWTVPPDRMKAKKEHHVPLSTVALAFLRNQDVKRLKPDALVFPGGTPKSVLSDTSLLMVVRRMNDVPEGKVPPWRDGSTGEPIVPHGFRSTFRDWASEETEFPDELVEMSLAHTVGNKVRKAYARSVMLERRRPLMEAWGRFCGGCPKVK